MALLLSRCSTRDQERQGCSVVNGQSFTISPTVRDNKLESSCVSIACVKDLATFQENKELKLAPHLTPGVLAPPHFEKMKVSNALSLLSHSVRAGIRYMVECEG